jgi:cytidylate kinase
MRDYEDTHRSESPLRQAEDAIVLDNTFLNPLEQLNFVKDLLSSRQLIAL